MVNITLYRSSGAPVETEHKETYMEHLNKEMDRVEDTIGKCKPDNAEMYADAMNVVHDQLLEDFPISKQIQYPTTSKQLKTLCDEYGSIAFCMEDGKLTAYILDK